MLKKAILIDTMHQTLRYVMVGEYTDIYGFIGNDCTCFTVPVDFPNGDAMYCDDEGLFHPFYGGIVMKDWVSPIVGNILILGTDDEGESVDVKTTIEELAPQIKFLSSSECLAFARGSAMVTADIQEYFSQSK